LDFSCVFLLFLCWLDFDLLLWPLFSFIPYTVISSNKWDIRNCDWKILYIYQHMQLRMIIIVKKNQDHQ
jgi:hypothetical protein